MYVRDPKSKVTMTGIHKNFDNALIQINALKKINVNNTCLQNIDIKKAYNLMVEDIKNKDGLIFGCKR